MTHERYQRVGHIYHAALELSPEDRAAFLDSTCGGDRELRREVESLLSAHDKMGDYFATPAIEVASRMVAQGQNPSLVGRSLSHYRVLSLIGAGGMGEVYLAQDMRLNRRVAIKFLHPESVADERARKRLLREAQATAKLDHPNICAIYEIEEEEGRSFIVMQYVEGETLADRMQRKPLEFAEALDVAIQVADALSEAHSRGIIHRDIKPANVMVTPRGQVRVMDFGLVKVIRDKNSLDSEAETQSLLSEPGVIVGTVPYMSPEQVKGEALDVRSDIFSFGAFLYEMVSGRHPFVRENAAATISAILTQQPPPLTRYVDVPAEVQRIVRKCLEKDRENRYQSARELLIDLKSLKRDRARHSKACGNG
jgi:serine/threonine protein kinase